MRFAAGVAEHQGSPAPPISGIIGLARVVLSSRERPFLIAGGQP